MRVARLATRTLSQKSKQRYFAVTQMPDPCSPVEFGRVSAFLLQKLQSTRYAMATMIRRKISVKTKFCNRSSTADTSQSLLLSGSTWSFQSAFGIKNREKSKQAESTNTFNEHTTSSRILKDPWKKWRKEIWRLTQCGWPLEDCISTQADVRHQTLYKGCTRLLPTFAKETKKKKKIVRSLNFDPSKKSFKNVIKHYNMYFY